MGVGWGGDGEIVGVSGVSGVGVEIVGVRGVGSKDSWGGVSEWGWVK